MTNPPTPPTAPEPPAGSLPLDHRALLDHFGRVDIYLFDQLLRGRITPEMTVLDAGCGPGRNVRWLLRAGARVFGVDRDPDAVARVRALAAEVAPEPAPERFQVAELDHLPFADARFDAVLASAVLHFAEDEDAFEAMLGELWRVLRPGGVFFARLASTIGVEGRVQRLHGRRFHLPDGTDRFLVDEAYLLGLGELMGGELLDPIKTTNVQNRRAMTTWVLRKGGGEGGGAGAVPELEAARSRGRTTLAPLLGRLESALYRTREGADGGTATEDGTGGEGAASGAPWTPEEEAALEREAAGYPDDVRELAAELARALSAVRGGAGGLDRAKASLSALRTRVLMEDALRPDG